MVRVFEENWILFDIVFFIMLYTTVIGSFIVLYPGRALKLKEDSLCSLLSYKKGMGFEVVKTDFIDNVSASYSISKPQSESFCFVVLFMSTN